MTRDYFVHMADEMRQIVEQYHREISRHEHDLGKAAPQKRDDIKKQIETAKLDLTSRLQADVTQPVSQKLATRLIEDLSLWWFQDLPRKEDARHQYMSIVRSLRVSEPGKIANDLDLRPDLFSLPASSWVGICLDFELLTSWCSKDARVFHLMDNPVRKDRVFGVPFMSAASWKGLLRWACLMQKNLRKHPEEGKSAEESRDSDWILPLFGNEKGEKEHFHQGALVFYPTWFDKVGFEVINPHSRERRAGTQPIYYEVVPPGAQGTLYLLYAPWPGMAPKVDPKDFMPGLLEAIEALLTTYGISAKRTVGWGTAKITKWQAFRKGEQSPKVDCRKQLEQIIHAWFETGGTR